MFSNFINLQQLGETKKPRYKKNPKLTADSKLDDTVPDIIQVKTTITVVCMHSLGIIQHDNLLPEINTFSTVICRQNSQKEQKKEAVA